MEGWLIAILAGAVPSIISGVVLVLFKRRVNRSDEMESRINKMEAACNLCRGTILTEDRLRRILQEFFDQFELRLINEGRLRPRHSKRGEE